MTQSTALDKSKSAVLIMDFQDRIVNNVATDPEGVVRQAARTLDGARQAGIPVIYVVHRGGDFRADSTDLGIHSGVTPKEGETIVTKTRTSPFSSTGLDVQLREMGRDTLVIMGVATSGCVLSTVRWAADINYKLVVVSDACSDRDPEVHRVLTEKVYPRQATVMTTDEFLQAVA